MRGADAGAKTEALSAALDEVIAGVKPAVQIPAHNRTPNRVALILSSKFIRPPAAQRAASLSRRGTTAHYL